MSDVGGGVGDPGADAGGGDFWGYFDSGEASVDGFDTIESPEYQAANLASDLESMIDEGFDTGEAGTRLSDSEIASFLGVGQAEVSEAGHEFRGDAQGEFGMPTYRSEGSG